MRRTRTNTDKKVPTITDVAAAAGVTTATVSFAFSGKRFVAPETRELVLNAARQLDYAPNPHAVRLATGRVEDLIALFTLTLDQGVGTEKLLLIQRALYAAGYRAPIHGYDFHAAFNLPEQVSLMRDLRMQRPRGIVCAAAGVHPDAIEELRRFAEEGGVVACLCYGDPIQIESDQVIFDEADNTYQSTRHLLSLGHRRLGFYKVGLDRHYGPRYHGFRRALCEYDVPYREEWHFRGGDIALQEESGVVVAREWALMPVQDRPTGLCIVNDRTAQGFIVEAFRLGMSVPEDVSVVGHDDQPPAVFGRIPLTTVSHPVTAMVDSLVKLLTERLEGVYDGPARRIVHRGELVIRASTAPVSPEKKEALS
ncbi:MAG: LacI family DNA-binding transcriptional regulator [Akkermansiaceae bacterium]|nr:LacI family DNA-binding transcriptional regulator [Armatimonadota bacterium]